MIPQVELIKIGIASTIVLLACLFTWHKTSEFYEAKLSAIEVKAEVQKQVVTTVEKQQATIAKEISHEARRGSAVIDDYYRLRQPKAGSSSMPGVAFNAGGAESGASGSPVHATESEGAARAEIESCEAEAAKAADLIYIWQIREAEQQSLYEVVK